MEKLLLKYILTLSFPVSGLFLCKIEMAVLSHCFSPLHRSMTNSWMKENTPLMNGKVGIKTTNNQCLISKMKW